jgi:hypothetical protein
MGMVRAGLRLTDQLLRGDGPFRTDRAHDRRWWWLVLMIIAFGAAYGAAMGTFLLDRPERWLQVLYSASKVPLLLLSTTTLCLPAFYAINTVLGLREDLRVALQAILAGQAALGVALAALAPLTHFWYWCDQSYRSALLFNAAMFTLATIGGQIVIQRYYGELIRRNARHRYGLACWLGLYAFVGIQMGWVLRPFVGDPHAPTRFFRPEPFSNAYVVIFHLLAGG